MKKLVAVCLCLTLIVSLAVLPTSAAPSIHEAFASLVSFEDYKCHQVQPNGFAASVIQDEMMEDYAFDLPIEWWGEDAPDYVDAAKADFEAYVNLRYEVSAATWDAIRAITVGYYDVEKDDFVQIPFYNTDTQTYRISRPGGYGGAISSTDYIGYAKNGEFYHVYLQLLNIQETKPTTGVEGKDWYAEEMYGEIMYVTPLQQYHKYVVTYKNGIMKKYKSTAETAVPATLVKPGDTTASTTTTKQTTTTSKTETGTTTTVTVPEKPLITLVEKDTVKLESAADAFPQNAVVTVEEITETAKLETVQQAIKETVRTFVAYEITATSNNVAVQPNGTVKATFAIPAGYDLAKVAVFYVSDNGETEAIPATVDAATNTVTAELSHFSTYIVAEKNVADVSVDTDIDTDTDTDSKSPIGWIIAVVAVVALLGGVAVWYFVFFRKK